MATPTAAKPAADNRLKILHATMKRYRFEPDSLLEVLHSAQELFGYLDTGILMDVVHSLRVPPSRVYGVATFYNFFSLKPRGTHTCVVCMGTACYVKGSTAILNAIEEANGVKPGETTPDGQLSLATARCLGACGIAPAVVFDEEVAGRLTAAAAVTRVGTWKQS